MKEETFKEYTWHGKDVNKLFKKAGIEGEVVTLFSSYDRGKLYLHIKTLTESAGK